MSPLEVGVLAVSRWIMANTSSSARGDVAWMRAEALAVLAGGRGREQVLRVGPTWLVERLAGVAGCPV